MTAADGAPGRWSAAVGRVGGVPVAVHASWPLAFGLLSGVLAGGLLPAESPGWTVPAYWAAGLLTSLALFGSLLAHELAHCRTARGQGLAVRRITLFVFGAVSEIDGVPDSPRSAFRIAAAGPLASLALAALWAVVGLLTSRVPLVAAPATVLARLNVVLAAFNLLPGHPLDGGRMLHAVVWRLTGDRGRAMEVSTRVGRWVSLGIVTLGILLLLGGVAVGAWLLLIGWLQHATAAAAGQAALLERALAGVTVAEVLGPDARVAPGESLDRVVAEHMVGRGARCVLVAEAGRLRGLVTLRDLRAVPRERWSAVGVESVMRPEASLVTTSPEEPLLVAVRKMDDARVGQLPVTANGRLVGLLTREQVLRRVRAGFERPR